MKPKALAGFLTPRSIAVVGASPQRGSIRGLPLHLLAKNRFTGALHAVNPSYTEVNGTPCWPSVAAIGSPVDLAIIAIPASAVPAALEDCAAAGVRFAIVISSGFAEEGPEQARLQARMGDIAAASGMRICGPNGQGYFNAIDRIAATFSPSANPDLDNGPTVAGARRLAVISQSGGVGFSFYDRGRALGLPFSHVISSGNECDLTLADYLDLLVDDADTGAVLIYVEAVRDLNGFRAAVDKARAAGKPVIALKVGRSKAGARAALAHTASEAGDLDAWRTLCTEAGVVQACGPDDALARAAALCSAQAARGPRVGIVTTAGGAGGVLADALCEAGLDIPCLTDPTQAVIRPSMPTYGSAANPVDVTAQGIGGGGLQTALEHLMAGDEVDAVVLAHSLSNEGRVSLDLEKIAALRRSFDKPLLVYSYTLPSAFARAALAEAGLVAFSDVRDVAAAMTTLTSR